MGFAHSRSELTSIAKELGLWGSAVTFTMSTPMIEAALRAKTPPDAAKHSTIVRRFYGALNVDLSGPPVLGVAVPDELPVGSVDDDPEPDVLTPEPEPSAPKPPAAFTPKPPVVLVAQAPVAHQAVPAPPAIGAAAAFIGMDLAAVGLVAVDCPGSIADNNAVCLVCPELLPCLDQALGGTIRYPDRYTAKSEAVSAPPEPEPETAPTPAKARRGRSPKAKQDEIPEAIVDQSAQVLALELSKVAKGLVAFFAQPSIAIPCVHRPPAVFWFAGATPVVRMTRIAATKPTVQLLTLTKPEDSTGVFLDKRGVWTWDGGSAAHLEPHLRAAIKLAH